MTWIDWAFIVVLAALVWWHGWHVGRKAGFDEILESFADTRLHLADVERIAREKWEKS